MALPDCFLDRATGVPLCTIRFRQCGDLFNKLALQIRGRSAGASSFGVLRQNKGIMKAFESAPRVSALVEENSKLVRE
jgi:hypothetical protein